MTCSGMCYSPHPILPMMGSKMEKWQLRVHLADICVVVLTCRRTVNTDRLLMSTSAIHMASAERPVLPLGSMWKQEIWPSGCTTKALGSEAESATGPKRIAARKIPKDPLAHYQPLPHFLGLGCWLVEGFVVLTASIRAVFGLGFFSTGAGNPKCRVAIVMCRSASEKANGRSVVHLLL